MSDVILVLGASGQIGIELTQELRILYGNKNVIASDIRKGGQKMMASGPFEIIDATDKETILVIIKKYNVTQVYLLAAMLSATAEQQPQRAWDLNMNSLINVLDLAKDKYIKQIYWPSSIAVFGPKTPKENTPQNTIMQPSTVYGISKVAGEFWCNYYHEKYILNLISINKKNTKEKFKKVNDKYYIDNNIKHCEQHTEQIEQTEQTEQIKQTKQTKHNKIYNTTNNYDIIARFQGGPNAGHTLVFNGMKHVLHTIPSGIFHKEAVNLVGNGVVIDPVIFKKELDKLSLQKVDYKKSLVISRKAHLILPTHKLIDAASEKAKGKEKIGSTLKGIGPTYMDKTGRNGLRVGDISAPDFKEKYEKLKRKHIQILNFYDFEYELEELETAWFSSLATLKKYKHIESEHYIHNAMRKGKKILAEGAQGTLLDIDFGSYPFVTSSNTITAGACTGLGIAPNKIGEVFGIFKAYCTRVGSGPFPSELFDKVGARLAKVGNEFGATTGRPRRCGWIDIPALKYAININGVTQLMMMKGDVLSGFDTLKVCTSYNYKGKEISHLPYNIEPENVSVNYSEFKGWQDDLTQMTSEDQLPQNLLDYVAFIEKETGVEVSIVSVGPDRKQTITR